MKSVVKLMNFVVAPAGTCTGIGIGAYESGHQTHSLTHLLTHLLAGMLVMQSAPKPLAQILLLNLDLDTDQLSQLLLMAKQLNPNPVTPGVSLSVNATSSLCTWS